MKTTSENQLRHRDVATHPSTEAALWVAKDQMADKPVIFIDLVDDDLPVLRALSRLLRVHRFLVRAFASGKEFIDSLADYAPDCVILDLQMPEMSGLEVCARLRGLGLDTLVIFMTALENAQADQLVASGGAVASLCKPVRFETLCSAIRSSMARRHRNSCEPSCQTGRIRAEGTWNQPKGTE
jgi:FixJ family two-component response regulator